MIILKKNSFFFENIKISIFDFKSYTKFAEMSGKKVFFNLFIFVFLISLFYLVPFSKDFEVFKELNLKKEEIFHDINYSDGILNIKNSPTVFSHNNFILIGDTRDTFNKTEYKEADNYRNAIYLLKNSFIVKQGIKEVEINYRDLAKVSFSKNDVFYIINVLSGVSKIGVNLVPFIRTIRYFVYAFISSLFAFLFSTMMRFRYKVSQVYKMELFAQSVPFLIISIFDIISLFNGNMFMYPTHILQFLTITLFLMSLFSIKKEILMKNLKNKK